MIYTEQAIKKAIESGWTPKQTDTEYVMERLSIDTDIREGNLYTDPLFWQSLGKALGWDEVNGKRWESEKFRFMPVWRHYWHSFIDHLALGWDAESFFKDLLTNTDK